MTCGKSTRLRFVLVFATIYAEIRAVELISVTEQIHGGRSGTRLVAKASRHVVEKDFYEPAEFIWSSFFASESRNRPAANQLICVYPAFWLMQTNLYRAEENLRHVLCVVKAAMNYFATCVAINERPCCRLKVFVPSH